MRTMAKEWFQNNPRLKKVGVKVNFTKRHVEELIKCKNDPIYFIENYYYIISDDGEQRFKLYDYQRELIEKIHGSSRTIVLQSRQTGKSTTTSAYLLWYALFNKERTSALLANKAAVAKEVLAKIRYAYERLPFFLQQGIIEWNKTSLHLENNSRIISAATSSSAIRGFTIHNLVLDEYAHVHNNLAKEFSQSVFPTIASVKNSKVTILSTPNKLNHFYELWERAVSGKSGYTHHFVPWDAVPGRDSEWKTRTVAEFGEALFVQEFECKFDSGSSNSLIPMSVLKDMKQADPVITEGNLKIYEKPIEDHQYVIAVDCARGLRLDYSAFVVVDITSLPYRVVAVYRDNEIAPSIFPNIIFNAARLYNEAFALVEINDIGGQVADVLKYELGYQNMFSTQANRKIAADKLFGTSASKKTKLGLRTTGKVKIIGTANLNTLIINNKLIISDFDIISELSTFILVKNSYKADKDCHDDLAMCLVMFAWLTTQQYFKDLTDYTLKKELLSDNQFANTILLGRPTAKESMEVVDKGDLFIANDWQIFGW